MRKVAVLALLLPLLASCMKDEYVDYTVVDEKIISEYLAARPEINAERDASGLYYEILEMGEGAPIGEDNTQDDKVTFSFTSETIDGVSFYDNEKNHTSNLSTLPYSFQIGLSQINKEGEITLYSPSLLCRDAYGYIYGKENTVMIYHINVKKDQSEIDDAIISTYLAENQIEAVKDESGIYYEIIEEGDEEALPITSTSAVKVSYVGTFLDGGEEFDSGETLDQYGNYMAVTGFIEGWRTMLPMLKKGSKVVLYCPSQLAYGSNDQYDTTTGKITMEGNSILVFDMHVLDVH
ncbi:FKBP-type peptidyl-prolyl cis-trans isomerase [Carboxylicivirga sp. M1479]|uniref:FKBP-type peptidyl-prolyl cis-trans isomerase n=1 Tax=Carboxylicivirga sp. M1479 TaxID=2594476 RepID=UPI0011777BB5|nr:FKBP-type peptidyl-prolyl cis-trans isomerase [Carboxylicivirga sp. M1479]TRX71375.1 hypothetical protein FNN09_07225 [Carboxylicivirga sp. M1479]